MSRRYYTSRSNPKAISIDGLYWKLQHLYLFFRDKDYFRGKAGITSTDFPDSIKHKAALSLNFQPFPITKWNTKDITEDHIFDVIEFLYDHVSKPGEWVPITSETGWNYYDYEDYDDSPGQEEFRSQVNVFLSDYKNGYELSDNGMVLTMGSGALMQIFDAEIVPYDEVNVDSKIRDAILKWRNRRLDMTERRQAIRELADVFEWLKKTKNLSKVINRKDESAIFEIANNFSIRHHDPSQKRGYDESIWYSWIFHFYLATYHAIIRLLQKYEKEKKVQPAD
ncbi:hypothetical protein ACFL7M_16880 [Thermodesulfobacteriota bacterium]